MEIRNVADAREFIAAWRDEPSRERALMGAAGSQDHCANLARLNGRVNEAMHHEEAARELRAAVPKVTPAGEEPTPGANVYAIGAVFVVSAPNARDAWNFFESSEHSEGAHAASNPHAITREQAMDPDWTIGLTYGATELAPIPADEEEQS